MKLLPKCLLLILSFSAIIGATIFFNKEPYHPPQIQSYDNSISVIHNLSYSSKNYSAHSPIALSYPSHLSLHNLLVSYPGLSLSFSNAYYNNSTKKLSWSGSLTIYQGSKESNLIQ